MLLSSSHVHSPITPLPSTHYTPPTNPPTPSATHPPPKQGGPLPLCPPPFLAPLGDGESGTFRGYNPTGHLPRPSWTPVCGVFFCRVGQKHVKYLHIFNLPFESKSDNQIWHKEFHIMQVNLIRSKIDATVQCPNEMQRISCRSDAATPLKFWLGATATGGSFGRLVKVIIEVAW